MAKALMIQGAGSNVGKSMLVAGLARAFSQDGLKVVPFKPQNMSNNAAVTVDGGEIGRAQALQARASGVPPHTDMNPVLLKPETDVGAQVVVQGKRYATLKAKEYGTHKAQLLPRVLESFERLKSQADLILVEGAGSPAEINLRAGDIANMGFAEAANIPVALIGDIDRGGVIAQLVGTHAVLPADDRDRIKAFAVNKFRGDTTLFEDGMETIAKSTGWAPLGIVPWFSDAWKLPAEDIMDLKGRKGGRIKVAVPRLNRVANFDDLDPLSAMPEITVDIIEAGRPLPGDADLVLIPGSKSTIGDLTHFREQGWDIDLFAHVRRGGAVLGICGGYQMLGKEIWDDEGIEGPPTRVDGLGLLNVITAMKPEKRLALTDAMFLATGDAVQGYEIHIGVTTGPDRENAWLAVNGAPEGASARNGQIKGCYLHGLFAADAFRASYFESLGHTVAAQNYSDDVEQTIDALATHLEMHMDVDALLATSGDVSL